MSSADMTTAVRPSLRERILDLVFLVGVVVKGLDGLVEFVGGGILLFVTPAQILGMTQSVFAHELAEDPDDPIANAVLHGVAHLDSGATTFLAAYLLVHGVVKLAVVVALLLGSRRVYPWAVVVLLLFLIYQLYELFTAPSAGVVILTVLDAVIIWLTWREWRHGRTLHETARGTIGWILRRDSGLARAAGSGGGGSGGPGGPAGGSARPHTGGSGSARTHTFPPDDS